MNLFCSGTYHPIGTCAMGKVVDSSLHVIGVDNLRVVDASVIPTPITAHIQSTVYALAEQAADIIAAAR
jgi:choline dehydrogenase-like flavoprotein